MDKKDKKNILIFTSIFLFIGIVFLCSNYYFGSKTDWLTQHVSFAEYFRNYFYETKNIFPDFSYNLGSGQNMFNFAYYGLYNPIILISFLLPVIPMKIYIIASSLLCILVATIMLYFFIKKKTSSDIAFISGLLFLLASPILFHAHRHIMFVNYMPFLIMGLYGVDSYLKENKKALLILSIILMILTSYYYSIDGILVLIIYYMYQYVLENKKGLIKNTIKFIIPIILSILITCFFLLPTAYALKSGRIVSTNDVNILSLFIPNIKLNNILYSSYSLGMTSILIFTLIYFVTNKKYQDKILGIIISIICFIPICVYILNVFLYARTKVLIPFIPLIIYMISKFIEDVLNKKINIKKIITIDIIINIIIFILGYHQVLYYLDSLVVIISLLLYNKFNKKYLFVIPIILISIINCVSSNVSEKFMPKKQDKIEVSMKVKGYHRTNSLVDTLYEVNDGTNYTTSVYSSVYNPHNYNLWKNVFDNAFEYRNKLVTSNSNNLLYQTFMGVKNVISDSNNLIGYNKVDSDELYNLLENNDVFSIGYSNSNYIGLEQYKTLKYPYNVEALLNNIVVDKEIEKKPLKSNIEQYKLEGTYAKDKLDILPTKNGYIVNSDGGAINYKLNDTLENQILLIDFDMEKEQSCKIGDQGITINKITNTLTCKTWQYKNNNHHFSYVISEKILSELNILFSKGHYEISNIHIYKLDYNYIKNIKHDNLEIKTIKYDTLKGNINITENSYFTISIPYDKGFIIKVDDKKINYEKVNIDLIGFKLDKGYHKIEITYEAPFFKLGKIISIICILITILYLKKKW